MLLGRAYVTTVLLCIMYINSFSGADQVWYRVQQQSN